MNIYLPIISNVIILAILVAGLFIGRKNGWATQLLKLGFVVASGVGAYFLAPVIAGLFVKIELLATMMSIKTIMAISFGLIVLVAYILLEIIYAIVKAIIKRKKENKVKVKVMKVKSLDKKAARDIRKRERKTRRENRKALKKANRYKISKTSKIIGAILGVITGILVAFIMLLPVKYALRDIATQIPGAEQIVTAYEYTPYGQLDKLFDAGNFIVRGE